MIKKLPIYSIIFIVFFLTGCKQYLIVPEEEHTFLHKGLLYSVAPYTKNNHQNLKIHHLLANHSLTTTFILKIKNTNETPVLTKINNSFVLIDSNHIQYKPFENTYPFLEEILNKSNYKELSYSELMNLNLELERLQERDISSSNTFLYENELENLQKKIYNIERNHLLQIELKRTEKEIENIIERYRFEDSLIYPDAEIISLVIFPAISYKTNHGFFFKFIIDNTKTITIPYKLKQTN